MEGCCCISVNLKGNGKPSLDTMDGAEYVSAVSKGWGYTHLDLINGRGDLGVPFHLLQVSETTAMRQPAADLPRIIIPTH